MSAPKQPKQAPITSTQPSNTPNLQAQEDQVKHSGANLLGFSGVPVGVQASFWNGPYPPPDAIKVYEQIEPGAFNRILAMNEKRQEADIEIAKRSTYAAIADTKRANYMGFAVTIGALVGGFCLIGLGHSTSGVAIILCYGIGAGLSFFLRREVGPFTKMQQKQSQNPQGLIKK